MHVSFASTYPPRACGLATFTQDLRGGLDAAGVPSDVLALVRSYSGSERPSAVAFEVRQDVRDDYTAAADFLAAASADVLCVQHEFGIFGGPEGTYVLDLLDAAEVPIVTTLHTVLPEPEAPYRSALDAVARRSARLVVMTETAREILASVYGVDPARVAVIPHGAPDRDPEPPLGLKARLGLDGRTVLLTFGLLGPSKGIEFAIDALARAVEAQPDALYVVLGATHPEIVRTEGEVYREALQADVAARGLQDHVRFVDRYVDTPELWDWLTAADVYVSPYPGMDQICSGTLAYALAAGLPVVSTPYLHAREVLAGGAGRLAPFGDVAAFGDALAAFASGAEARADASAAARRFGASTTWPRVGAAYADVFDAVRREAQTRTPARAPAVHPAALPAALDYLDRLTDDVGPFQHATFGLPDRAHGYCTDDAGRAIVAALAAARQHAPQSAPRAVGTRIARTCLAFVAHAQTASGTFHNFMDYGRRFTDTPTGEDTAGRALWGLGAAIAWGPDAAFRTYARTLLARSLDLPLEHPRAIAYAICGLALALDRLPGVAAYRTRLREHAQALVDQYRTVSRPDWPWVCDEMTYANALVPHALWRAADRLAPEEGADAVRDVAQATSAFVLDQSLDGDRFEAIGNDGWHHRDGARAFFDQQPIEAGYAAWAWADAARRGDPRGADAARAATAWFYGRNRIGEPVFDVRTGAAYDGFGPRGVNQNQGAESAIACLLAHLALLDLDGPAETAHAAPLSDRR